LRRLKAVTVAQFLTQLAQSFEHPSVAAQWAADAAACAANARRCRDFATIALNEESHARREHARLCALLQAPRRRPAKAKAAPHPVPDDPLVDRLYGRQPKAY
jgi:hypothetical protein